MIYIASFILSFFEFYSSIYNVFIENWDSCFVFIYFILDYPSLIIHVVYLKS